MSFNPKLTQWKNKRVWLVGASTGIGLTKHQAAVIGAYTGILCGPFRDLHEYAEKLLERPVWTHEFADRALADELKQRAQQDFFDICHKKQVD